MSSSTFRDIEWGPMLMGGVGCLLFLLGVARFILRHSFSLSDALYCCLVMIPVGVLLIVIAYVVQHAIFASIIPIAFAALLAYTSPVFDVALGLALTGAVIGPVLSDWKSGRSVNNEAVTPVEKETEVDK